jgi:hypothetical protein
LYFEFYWEFELLPKRKVVPFEFIFYLAKVGNCWTSGMVYYVFFKSGQLGIFGEELISWKRVTQINLKNSNNVQIF